MECKFSVLLNNCRQNITSLSLLVGTTVPAHPASFSHNFFSGMQSFYYSQSQDAMVLKTCLEKIVFLTHKFVVGPIDMVNKESQDL